MKIVIFVLRVNFKNGPCGMLKVEASVHVFFFLKFVPNFGFCFEK